MVVAQAWFTGVFTETRAGQGLGHSAPVRSGGRFVTDAGGGHLLARRWLVLVDKVHPIVAVELSQGWRRGHSVASPSCEQRPLPFRAHLAPKPQSLGGLLPEGNECLLQVNVLHGSYITPLGQGRALCFLLLKRIAEMEKVAQSQ